MTCGGAVQQLDIAVAGTPAPTAPARRRRTRRNPSPRSASRADGRNASARDRSCRGTGICSPGVPQGMAKFERERAVVLGVPAEARRIDRDLVGERARAWPARARRARRCRRLVSRTTCSAVPSCRLNMPETLRLRCRLISEWVRIDVVLADVLVVAAHVVARIPGGPAPKIVGRARPRRRRSRS